jgi:hypothetical protein
MVHFDVSFVGLYDCTSKFLYECSFMGSVIWKFQVGFALVNIWPVIIYEYSSCLIFLQQKAA